MHKFSVGVLGASGYAGRELCMLIDGHPQLELRFAAAHAQRGQTTRIGGRDVTFVAVDDAPLQGADLVFSALPHGASIQWVEKARAAGARVVDLSSDLRPGNGVASNAERAPYGLTEIARDTIAGASLVSNPGCYPTAILLALIPLARNGLLREGSPIVASAASGVTGAGYSAKPELLFAEVSEDFRAYGVGNEHRHLPEMTAILRSEGTLNDVVFTPHLLPVARGILATITVQLEADIAEPLEPWLSAYGGEPFIEVTGTTPSLREVVRRNVVRISAARAANTNVPTLIVTAAIDNLTKGAAGQAIQNANLMLGIDETAGLPA